MDNLEKNLSNLPKPKLRRVADLQIRWKIYRVIFLKGFKNLMASLLHPHSLWLRVSYMAFVLIVLLGGSAVYAANNDNITPGHSLYPLKKTVETVEQTLSFTKESQVNTLNKISERRLKEAINVASDNIEIKSEENENKEIISHNLEELVGNLNEVVNITQEIDDIKQAQKIKDDVKQKNEEVIKYLDNLENITKDKKDRDISEQVNKAKETIKKYQKILEDDEKSFDQREDSKKSLWERHSDDSRDNDEESKNNDQSDRKDSVDENRDRENDRD